LFCSSFFFLIFLDTLLLKYSWLFLLSIFYRSFKLSESSLRYSCCERKISNPFWSWIELSHSPKWIHSSIVNRIMSFNLKTTSSPICRDKFQIYIHVDLQIHIQI
jgi:hypothetical protein